MKRLLASFAAMAAALSAAFVAPRPAIRYAQSYPLPRRHNTGVAAMRRQARKARNRRRARRA